MPKIPAPNQGDDDCVTFAGMTVCPHTVYLTPTQKKTVHAMHRKNVSRMKRLARAARTKRGKKKRKL